MLSDSVQQNPRYQYQLAHSLIDGTDGLLKNTLRGIQILQQLTRIPIDPTTNWPIYTIPIATTTTSNTTDRSIDGSGRLWPQRDVESTMIHIHNDNNNEKDESYYVRNAMKTLAYLYLDDDDEEEEEEVNDNDKAEETSTASSSSSSSTSQTTLKKQIGLQWLLCALHMGQDSEAAYEIATIYEYGTYEPSIPMDLVKAIDYLQLGAMQGHVESMVELALHYEMGCHDILPVNIELAYHWYQEAAQRGHVIAKYSIGEAYERGIISSMTTTSLSELSSSSSSLLVLPDSMNNNTNVNMTLACLYYYQAAIEGQDEDSIAALRRLYDIARIIIPGINTKLLQLYDKKERILTNE